MFFKERFPRTRLIDRISVTHIGIPYFLIKIKKKIGLQSNIHSFVR
jgi:hypothetical protein